MTKTPDNFVKLFKNGFRLYRLAFNYMPWLTIGMVAMTLVIGVTPIFSYRAMGTLIDSIVSSAKGGAMAGVWSALGIYAVLIVVPSLASNFRRYFDRIWFMRLQDYFDILLLKKRMEFDIAQYEDTKFLDFMQRAFNSSFYPLVHLLDWSMQLIQSLSTVVVGAVAALVIDWRVFLLVVVTSIPNFIIEVKFGGKIWSIYSKSSQERRRDQDLRRFFSLGGRHSVIDGKLSQVSGRFLKMIKKIITDFTDDQLKAEHRQTSWSIVATLIAGFGLFFGTAIVIKSAIAGMIAIGTVVYAFQTLSRTSSQTSQLLSVIAKLLERNLYVTDIFAVMDTEPSLVRSKHPQKLNLSSAPHIVFDNVSFKYPGQDTYALKNISFEILPGEKLGMVGNNGSGKSTIVRLLLRVHDPCEGKIFINGIDLKELDLDEWWTNLGVLLQDFVTYNFSVKESVAIGRSKSNIDIDLVKESVRKSTADTFIDELDGSYDHMIGVEFGGIEPSKGQRQKLAIASALYRSPYLLVLDEPTASIDSESASKIFQEIESLPDNVSAILISHNFATIRRASKIIVLRDGKIIEEGTHDSLVSKKGLYAEAYLRQMKEFE